MKAKDLAEILDFDVCGNCHDIMPSDEALRIRMHSECRKCDKHGNDAASRIVGGSNRDSGNQGDGLDGLHETGVLRVARGGSFSSSAVFARSAFRYDYSPAAADPALGVRPARALME